MPSAFEIAFSNLVIDSRTTKGLSAGAGYKGMNTNKIMHATVLIAVVLFSGCSAPPAISKGAAARTGDGEVVIGGKQPIANSTIQLYAVGTTGDRTVATPLLTKVVTTDTNGNFSIAGLYSCTGATEVYVTATGGGSISNVTNPNLALMAALGPCTALNSGTTIVVNELTTIAAVNALAPFMTSYTRIGSGSGDIGDLDAAFALASQLVNLATGIAPGQNVPAGYTVPTDEINTLGNATASCIDSGGGTAGDHSACGTLFSLTTPSGAAPPTNTIAALLYLAENPDLNTSSIYELSSPNGPFQPQLSDAPLSFAIALTPSAISGSVDLNPTSVNFPITDTGSTSPAQSVTLTNNTTTNFSVSSVSITGADSVDFAETNGCPAVLVVGASCTIQVTFAPQAILAANATLQVNGGLFSVGLAGTSESDGPTTVPGTLQLSPTSITFPTTELGSTSQVQNLTLTNNTPNAFSISSIAISGADAIDFLETNTCPSTLVVGGSCTIQTTFSPQSTVASSAELQVNGGEVSATLFGPSDSPVWPAALLAADPAVYLNFNDSATDFLDQISGLTFSSGGGAVTPQQPGFDNTQPNNTSAGFEWNAWNAAPNNTLGAIDWDVPFSILVQIDRLNWNRTGSLVLMSKGDIGHGSGAWELVLQMVGKSSQLCFYEYGSVTTQGACTSGGDAMPNGFNYDIVVTNNGTGANGMTAGGSYPGNVNAVNLYINGISEGSPVSIYGTGFGALSFTVSGGTGYAALTPVTITGGGPNCNLTGFELLATNGVPSGIINSTAANPNYGCTSIPTVSLTSATGTGVVITPSLSAPTMNSAYPLMVPGYVSGGAYYGVAGTNSTQGPIYVDEAAIFPGVLTPTQIGEMYYQTKFYQELLGTRPAVPPVVVFDDDGCSDLDNTWALEEAIALHKLGFINIEGVIQEDNGTGNVAYYRQQLDQAGLTNVPIGIPSDGGSYSACNTIALNTFNATTLTLTNYPTAAQVYRQVFAANPSTPVSIMIGAELSGLANFMQSPADGISSMTGAQLFARNAANNGVLYSQGGFCTPSSLPATAPCTGGIGAQFTNSNSYADAAYVYANGTAMPMIAVGGTPAAAGPGPLATRTSKDPTYLQMSLLFGTDMRTAWDPLPMSALVSPYFYGGVTVGYSGGTGYAASTLFTSTGGGPNCTVTGYMTASDGVPNGITTLWGAAVPLKDEFGLVAGLGYGCTSAPTLTLISPTGTGVTLTAYPTTVCVTPTFPGYSSGQSSASGTCRNQYQSNLSQWTLPSSNAPVFQWFLNSLVDPPSD